MNPPMIDHQGWHTQCTLQASKNFDERPTGIQPELIVIHNISLPPNEFGGTWIDDLFLNKLDPTVHPYFEHIHQAQVSSHFLIRRTGELVQFVSCSNRAWHAGRSNWENRERCNDFSIGIELEGADGLPFTEAQYACLLPLIKNICITYPSITSIAGHQHIAPQRKTDPGSGFEWARVLHNTNLRFNW